MSGAATLVILPLIAAALVYALRRFASLAALLAMALIAGMMVFIWLAPLDMTVMWVGRPVLLSEPVTWVGITYQFREGLRPFFSFLYLITLITFLFAWRISQGRTFFSAGLIVLSLASLAMMAIPAALAPISLAFMACIAVFIVQSGRLGSTRGAFRQMWLPLAAFPFFLTAYWLLVQLPFNPDDPQPYQAAINLFGVGLILLLAPTPLHGPRVALGFDAPPLVAAFLQLIGEAVVLYLVRALTTNFIAIVDDFNLARFLIIGGLLTIAWGGIAAMGQRDVARLWGYAGLFNYGLLILAVALGLVSSWVLVLMLFGARTILILLGAMSLAILRQQAASTELNQVQGLLGRLPWTSVGLMAAGLGLVGFPLTVGFASQWTLIQQIAVRDARWLLIVLPAAILVALSYVRLLVTLVGTPVNTRAEREPTLAALLVALFVGLSAILGLVPQLLNGPVMAVITALSTLTGG